MDPDIIELADGAMYRIPGYSQMSPEQQQQRLRQLETAHAEIAPVLSASKELAARETDNSFAPKTTAALQEFTRNATGGLDAWAGAAVTPDFLTPEGSPLSGLSFMQRRDAIRGAQDIRAGLLPKWLDNVASAAGVLSFGTGPAATAIHGPAQAAKVGAGAGLIEGVGHSEGDTVSEVAKDAVIGTGIGASASVGADFVLDKLVGGAARRAFAQPGDKSRVAYEAQTALGIPPSVGSIGNRTAAGLENSFAEAPMTSGINRALPQNWGAGRSAGATQQLQIDMLEDALRQNVTNDMRPPGVPPARSEGELAYETAQLAGRTSDRLKDEVRTMEDYYDRLVPQQTPVNIQATRAVPETMRNRGDAETLARRADADVDAINTNRVYPVDVNLATQLTARKATLETEIRNAQTQLDRIPDAPGSRNQRANLSREIQRKQTELRNVNTAIYDNLGPGFRALRQERNEIGKATERDGLKGGQAKEMYGTITDDLAAAAERVRPGAAQEFLEMTSRESEIFGMQDILKRYADGRNSTNAGQLRNAVMRGNWDELDVLLSKATPEEALAFKADLIDNLGRTKGTDFAPKTFADNWRNMPEPAKQRITDGSPEMRALMDTVAEVADDFTKRGRAANHSNTAMMGSVIAGLGAAVAAPEKIPTFLAITFGIDRVVASEALAKAVAGETTALGQVLRRGITNYVATAADGEIGIQ